MMCGTLPRCVMSRDDALSLKDVPTILGHQHLSTTADIYLLEDEAQVIRRVSKHW